MANAVGVNLMGLAGLGRTSWRRVLASGVALAFVAGFVGSADAASRYGRTQTVSKKRDPAKAPFGELPKGPLQMVVSIGGQHVTLYANGQRIEQARVSTGTPGHPTPLGVFSVIEKDRFHRSNLYDSAPMFYMHRLTWSGVAMHEGVLPGFAASHGCIRMPTQFVSRLWQISKLGVRVVIARNDPVPYEFDHPKLFNPSLKPVAQLSSVEPRSGLGSTLAIAEPVARPVVLAQATVTDAVEQAQPPVEVEAPAASQPADVDTTAATPPAQAVDAPAVAPAATPAVRVQSLRSASRLTRNPRSPCRRATGLASRSRRPVRSPFSSASGRRRSSCGRVSNPCSTCRSRSPTLSSRWAPTSSRRWKSRTAAPTCAGTRSACRLSIWPVRSTSVAARSPGTLSRWRPTMGRRPSTAAEALNRINLPPEAVERISELLTPGSSLIVSDHGLGRETGRYTEFIVLTQ